MKRLKGLGKKTWEFAKKNDTRPFIISVTTEDGGCIEMQGSIQKKYCKKLCELQLKIWDLSQK